MTSRSFARIGGSILFALVLFEIALRIYDPIPFRVRGNRIVLPVGQRYRFTNTGTHKIDPVTYHTKNSLGFRGPDPPDDWSSRLTILTIGGSTTECLFLSDGKTWTDQLARRLATIRPDVWVNNAGLDGQSTFGHLVLMRDFVAALHPRVAVFLIGANDVGHDSATGFDDSLTPSGGLHRWVTTIVDHSAVAVMAQNLTRAVRSHRAGFGHAELDLRALPRAWVEPEEMEKILDEHRRKYLDGYRERVRRLVESSRQAGIEPVLVTQPALYGEAIDPTTGVDLIRVDVAGWAHGRLAWRLLELYNDVTRETAAHTGTMVIDLAQQLPKDSRYFYDFVHYSNEGAERVGDLVFETLQRLPAVSRR